MTDPSLYRSLASALRTAPVAVATVIAVRGSVPREVGAEMLVLGTDPDGEVLGTIGGGAGEAKTLQVARTVLATGAAQRVEIDLTGAPQTQGVCGGRMSIWVDRWQGDAAAKLAHRIYRHLVEGKPGLLVTPLVAGQLPNLAPLTGGDRAAASMAVGAAPQVIDGTFLRPLQQGPLLLIVGAGHVGVALARLAAGIGFQVAMQDDRPEFADPSRFPEAIAVSQASLPSFLPQLQRITGRSGLYVALVTRSYHHDVEALSALLLPEPVLCEYIGTIGSQKRIQHVHKALATLGILEEQLQRIRGPIGLDIGAQTPAEIAISICAELLAVRRGRTGLPLSHRPLDFSTRSV